MSRHLEFDIKSSSTSKTSRGNWQDYSPYQKFYGQSLVNRYENNEKKRRRKVLFGVVVLFLIFGAFLFYGTEITGFVSYHTGSFGGVGSSSGYSTRYTGTAQQGSGEASSSNYRANIGWFEASAELNVAPTINATFIPTSVPPLEASERTIVVNFTVMDTNGYADVNVSSATANFTRGTESPRYSSSCSDIGSGGDEINISCNVGMWYFDQAGDWNVTLHVKDIAGANATNTSGIFNYQSLVAFTISPSQLTWSEITRGATNQLPTNNVQVNHTGNAVIDVVQVNATQLVGETDNNHVIYAENFSVGPTTGGEAECSATVQQESIYVTISGASLTRGNLSAGSGAGQEELYYCLTGASDSLIKQAYSTALSRAWIIKLIEAFAAISIAKKKKKKKKSAFIERLNSELREEYGLDLDEVMSSVRKNKEKDEIAVPISIFSSESIAPAESLVRYLKENKKLKFSEIASMTNRNDRTIWTIYKHSLEKKNKLILNKKSENIPVSIFNDRRLSILESLIMHMRKRGMSNVDVSKLIGKDPRNVFTVYTRALKKIKKK